MMLTALLAACLPLADGADRITAADVARAVPAFAALPPETTLGPAPVPGARRVFSAAELERLARRYGIAPPAPRELCLERPVAPLEPAHLLSAMRASLPEASIELVDYSRYPVPHGVIEFPRGTLAPPPSSQPQAPVMWRGAIRYGGNLRCAIWAHVRIQVRTECVVAVHPLPAGRPIDAADLRRQVYAGFPPPGQLLLAIDQAAGRVPRRLIPAGTALSLDTLDPPYAVTRGQTVAVDVASGQAHLKLDARAEADGCPGQTIPILNLASGKRFSARIAAAGKVVVQP